MILRRTSLSLLSILASMAICTVSYAAEIFVDRNLSGNCTSGNYSIANRNCSGNNGIAYTNIQSAVNAAKAGDTITIRGGVYPERVLISKQGTASAWITIQAYAGETVQVDGGKARPTGFSGLVHLQSSQYIRISGIQVYNSQFLGINGTDSQNVIIEGCEVAYSGHGGIVFNRGSNVTIRQCDSHHNNAIGPSAGHEAVSLEDVDTFEVAGCKVHDNREEGIDAKYGSKNGRIHHNKSYNNNGPNIYIDSSSYIEVYNNEVYGANKAGMGIAVEYEWNPNRDIARDLKFYNNLVYDNGGGFWIWTAPNTESFTLFSNIYIVNNVIHANTRNTWNGGLYIDGGSQSNYGSNCVIRNNIFWDNTLSGARSIGGAAGLGMFSVDHNLFKQGQSSATFGTAAVQTTDVRFVDIAARNYRLQAGSPAIDAGSSVSAPTFDLDDAPRSGSIDIGPFEYQQGQSVERPGAPTNLRIQ